MTATQIVDDLSLIAQTARILSGAEIDGYEVDGLRPSAIVQPANAAEVAAVLRFASAHGLAVIPRGGGTAIDIGNPPARLDLILDLTRLDRIVEHRPQDLTVTVEAGATLGALQAALAGHGQMLGLDPPLAERATVGGILAANGSGPRRQRFGTARDLLIGSRVVLADGSQARAGGKVVKNVAGYDLNKLWIGSLGTLAVIVEATFKVTPLPAGFGLLLATFPDVQTAHAVALDVTRGRFQPLTLDLIGPPAAGQLSAGTRTAPTGGDWLLVAELGGTQAVVERTTRELMLLAAAGGSLDVIAVEYDQRQALMRRLRDYGRSHDDPATLILRTAVLPAETAIAARAICDAAGADQPTIIARVGSGIVYSYWASDAARRVVSLVSDLRGRVSAIGGQVVIERAPVSLKANLDVWDLQGPDRALMRRIKAEYDPAGVLSPGRLVDRSSA